MISKGKDNRIHIKHCMHGVRERENNRSYLFKHSLALLPKLLEDYPTMMRLNNNNQKQQMISNDLLDAMNY
jgi:hypothetical protein